MPMGYFFPFPFRLYFLMEKEVMALSVLISRNGGITFSSDDRGLRVGRLKNELESEPMLSQLSLEISVISKVGINRASSLIPREG